MAQTGGSPRSGITIGPYRFSPTDAAKTLHHFPELWDLLTEGRDASVVAHLLPDTSGAVEESLPRVWSALLAAGPALRAAGQLPPRADGVVEQVNASDGGVPKRPVEQLEVGFGGARGDRQATRVHHGRPWQALCLWSGEVIDTFAAAGHPLFPGAAGENATLRGLPWSEVRPGVRLQLGTVVCEVSAYAYPCTKNAQWFVDGDFMAMWHGAGPVSRVYATVLEPGRIRTGDPAILEP